jgi:chromosome segregation ATPase
MKTESFFTHAFSGLALWASLLTVSPAWAEAPKGDPAGQQALKKAQGMLRQLSQEKTALEAEKTALEEKLKKLEQEVKKIEPLENEVERHKASLETLKGSNDTLETQLQGERTRQKQLLEKQHDIVTKAKQIQSDNQLLVHAVKEREEWIAECGEKNRGMHAVNQELLGRYRDKSFWEKAKELEPFTGIGQVKAENTQQDYKFRLEDLQITAWKEKSREEAQAVEPAKDPTAAGDEEDDTPAEKAAEPQKP